MKKLLFLCGAVLLLSGCQERTAYEQAVMEQIKNEQDVKDYKLDPEVVTRCIVDLSSANMGGIFNYDPRRLEAFRSYAKMLTLKDAKNPQQVMEELRTEFGSPKGLAEAHRNYTESTMNCFASLIMSSEEEVSESEQPEQKPADDQTSAPAAQVAPAPSVPVAEK
ncbi:MAG: membrane lipoprotein lipid attachment site-containing protein [Methylicorpusculum sp.]|uniref:membrane lipoprotein lipid attachment site-containing protein n=1 Tax=Methylicorpusculum sp. TaxID=2713644 RepID=UPI00271D9D7C|nr:membrane lipoprotein lipid attachment site-containing protein [Methylicorpusculum sp.]MDO8939629.1 membrane lipoprotein lipid attachment site-containing protein [Methylicorpusculum sp.]MDP2203657.1 membrane lipoprotein lipid attachment site-containing protein [Methylicorpusculum sp.]